MKFNRRQFWLFLLGLAAAPTGLFAYMRREAKAYEVTHTTIPLPGITRPLKLIHLSDFHVSESVSYAQLENAIAVVRAIKEPDLICLTGDYMTSTFPDPEAFRKTLKPLAEHAPTYAVIGNHDFTPLAHGKVTFKPMLNLLRSCGFEALFNKMVSSNFQGQALEIAGLGDVWSGTSRPQNTLNTREKDSKPECPPRIVLSHNPDSKKILKPYDWDLMLCGHTHGGQLKIPFTDVRPILPISDRAYSAGLYHWEQRNIFITRGIGNLHGLRFNCRPEISVLQLTPPLHDSP